MQAPVLQAKNYPICWVQDNNIYKIKIYNKCRNLVHYILQQGTSLSTVEQHRNSFEQFDADYGLDAVCHHNMVFCTVELYADVVRPALFQPQLLRYVI